MLERDTLEQILNLNHIHDESKLFNIPTNLCFINYPKAFDCVRLPIMCLIRVEIPRHLILILWKLYHSNEAHVRRQSGLKYPFYVGESVRPGSILSLLLINIYGERIMRETMEYTNGRITFNGIKINTPQYADDTRLI